MKISKAGYFFLLYGVLIIIAAVIAWNQRGVHEAKAPEAPASQTTQQPIATNLKEYKDTDAGYSFSYPADIFGVYDKQLQLPFLNIQKLVDAVALVHTVPVEHCGLSGLPEHCTPSTTDISISFAPINYSIETIKKSKIGSELTENFINSHQAWSMQMGAEGEGRIDYYVALDTTHTLWISRTFIDENSGNNYKSVPTFIPFTKQEDLFQQIQASVSFIPKKYIHQNPNYSIEYSPFWTLDTSNETNSLGREVDMYIPDPAAKSKMGAEQYTYLLSITKDTRSVRTIEDVRNIYQQLEQEPQATYRWAESNFTGNGLTFYEFTRSDLPNDREVYAFSASGNTIMDFVLHAQQGDIETVKNILKTFKFN